MRVGWQNAASVLKVRAKRGAMCDSADKALAGVLTVRAKRARASNVLALCFNDTDS